jgi:hypothetical protein
MADKKPEPMQKSQPRGVDDKGQPAKPIDIPVPKREDFDKLLRRATKGKDAPKTRD